MSAPKPELTAELMAVSACSSHREYQPQCEYCKERESAIREAVEIVAKIDADEAYDMGLQTDDPAVIRRAILSHWRLK